MISSENSNEYSTFEDKHSASSLYGHTTIIPKQLVNNKIMPLYCTTKILKILRLMQYSCRFYQTVVTEITLINNSWTQQYYFSSFKPKHTVYQSTLHTVVTLEYIWRAGELRWQYHRWEQYVKLTAGPNWRMVIKDRERWKSLEKAIHFIHGPAKITLLFLMKA